MAELREDKKRKILDFLETNAETNDQLLALEVDQVIERFSDETFDEEAVEDIIRELEEDGLVQKKTAKLEIVYPEGYKKSVEEKFEHLFDSSPIFNTYFLGTVMTIVLINHNTFFDYFSGDAIDDPSVLVTRGVLFGVVGAYIVGKSMIRGFRLAQKHIQVLQEYKHVISPVIIIGAVVSSAAILYTTYTSQPFTTSHLIQIISISVVGGVAIGKFIANEDN